MPTIRVYMLQICLCFSLSILHSLVRQNLPVVILVSSLLVKKGVEKDIRSIIKIRTNSGLCYASQPLTYTIVIIEFVKIYCCCS
jgi:cytochrome c oxidase assembly protein Cox11